ncbi:MAG: YgiQ family radical SAM protein [Candidatus Nanoarchaeia archaeon]|nr:YgiQ family radical SAM protein [Candidatus Nanoarchaeia archaeon]
MIAKSGKDFDVIIITAEYYEDHPYSPAGVIAKVLEAKGFSVGIIEKPEKKEDYTQLGRPKLCFCITSGSIDSMLNNYTPLKRNRLDDKYSSVVKMPDRAVIFYCNKIKENFKGVKIVIGGIEASLRRFAHYDYWANDVRRSIILDSRADILVYGNGEKQIIEIATRIKEGKDLRGILGTCILSKEIDSSFEKLPSFSEVKADKVKFCKMQVAFSNNKNLAQEYNNNYVIQYKFPKYTPEDLDWIYSLDFSRNLRKNSLLTLAKFSVVTHRGCIGNCNFCSISLHQGDKIISRSEKSIIDEITRITKHPEFKGYIDDLGGPSANMYGMDCVTNCGLSCMDCKKLDKSHSKIISLLRKARKVKGVKKVFIRSGIRYDLAMSSKEYIKEISENHISGCLKIAPEHFSDKVLKLMNKDNFLFDKFMEYFKSINKNTGQSLKYYFMICHPGDDEVEIKILLDRVGKLKNIEAFQIFTPTPMSVSSCMYYTGMNPFTMQPIKIVYDYHTKKKMKTMMLKLVGGRKDYVVKKKAGR